MLKDKKEESDVVIGTCHAIIWRSLWGHVNKLDRRLNIPIKSYNVYLNVDQYVRLSPCPVQERMSKLETKW